MSLNLKIKKLKPDAVLPSYAHQGDAGLDIFCLESVVIAPSGRVSVSTGIAMEIPEGYVGLIWDKSGLSAKNGLKVLGGVVDSGYRGEVFVSLINLSSEVHNFERGHKVAQIIIQKKENTTVEEVTELSESVRGEGRFGSTGK